MDVDKLSPGDDFQAALQRSLSSCKVLPAIIGPLWAETTTADGKERLNDADDFVRKEIRAALDVAFRRACNGGCSSARCAMIFCRVAAIYARPSCLL